MFLSRIPALSNVGVPPLMVRFPLTIITPGTILTALAVVDCSNFESCSRVITCENLLRFPYLSSVVFFPFIVIDWSHSLVFPMRKLSTLFFLNNCRPAFTCSSEMHSVDHLVFSDNGFAEG